MKKIEDEKTEQNKTKQQQQQQQKIVTDRHAKEITNSNINY